MFLLQFHLILLLKQILETPFPFFLLYWGIYNVCLSLHNRNSRIILYYVIGNKTNQTVLLQHIIVTFMFIPKQVSLAHIILIEMRIGSSVQISRIHRCIHSPSQYIV